MCMWHPFIYERWQLLQGKVGCECIVHHLLCCNHSCSYPVLNEGYFASSHLCARTSALPLCQYNSEQDHTHCKVAWSTEAVPGSGFQSCCCRGDLRKAPTLHCASFSPLALHLSLLFRLNISGQRLSLTQQICCTWVHACRVSLFVSSPHSMHLLSPRS